MKSSKTNRIQILKKNMFIQVEVFEGKPDGISKEFNEWGLKNPNMKLCKLLYDDDVLLVFYYINHHDSDIVKKITSKAT